jgi:hypothetical protein
MRAAVVLLLIAMLGVAHADRKVALKFFRAGEKAYKAQQFATAAQNFYEAYKVLPLPEIAFSAAQAYRRQYRIDQSPEAVRRSVELYTFYLSKVKEGGRVGDAADSLGEMERELDKLGGKAASGVIVERTQLGVTVNLSGVGTDDRMNEIDDTSRAADAIEIKTWIDGVPVPPDKMMEVAPGDHVVRAEAAGFAPKEEKHPAPKGHSELVELELKALPARVKIVTEPEARVSIDGRHIGSAPVAEIELPAGRHVLTILRPGRHAVSRELVVARGQELTITQPLEATTRRASVKFVAGVAIGFGVIAAVTGGAALVQDREAEDLLAELRRGNHPPETIGRDYTNARAFRDQLVTGTWLFGATALGIGLAAGYLYYFDTPSAEGVRIAPIAGGGTSGAQLIGRF